jgi:hypothetical protein
MVAAPIALSRASWKRSGLGVGDSLGKETLEATGEDAGVLNFRDVGVEGVVLDGSDEAHEVVNASRTVDTTVAKVLHFSMVFRR